ncbi:unnamed protein product [Haemonchus placei]|uniref:KH_dom_type_1 domain-containing protein n=1 Tax=Haemonchus placei TaxID=6290 RepID=A0A0N4X413_HAEPC|nr:unnamed protein product [Haemonchus placei]
MEKIERNIPERYELGSRQVLERSVGKARRLQLLFVPKNLENILKCLSERVKGVIYDNDSIHSQDDKSEVLVIIGKSFSDKEITCFTHITRVATMARQLEIDGRKSRR